MSDRRFSQTYRPKSNEYYYESFGGWTNFMHSYGLKPWNESDVEQGKQIVEDFKRQEKSEWEEAQRGAAKSRK
ncbi:hypothetical protein BD779DRAFT_1559386 [Infundibulicybe gibba]|nr:hypothetical protein BD779DRAFT_1559386 [Infundibulicybe gibba]